ncbi:site-specific DNA-methyltransferase [Blautia faecis]|uniref:site-specific DNA-methyltransferase n=1 Tax=Blautia faecis TaxID=871665 RepID=UPI001654C750|nr:site-specific DNA-methyltransferase [Blautia faecis]MBC8614800.1 site-specific DNA-methyltransferase [Blautia faecis]
MDKMRMESPDMTAQNVDRIAALFPNCVTEVLDEEHSTPEKKVYKRAINFELLKQMLSPDVVEGNERYEFTWVGKKAAIVEANQPIRKTLRPCKEESKDWDTTENLYIEGDNLEVLKLLQESYLGKVKMIYIDPPYNTGNDFIYADDFMRSQEQENQQMGMYDEDGDRLFKNTDTNGRFHSDWCSMIYSRLHLAKNLLTDDGVIFISIDDSEVKNLKNICDEVFGAANFVAQLIWQNKKGGGNDSMHIAIEHEYILTYAKNIALLGEFYESYSDDYIKRYKEEDNIGRFFWDTFKRKAGKQYYPITCPDGTVLEYDEDGNAISWLRSKTRFDSDIAAGEIRIIKIGEKWSVQFKQRIPLGKTPRSIFTTETVIDDRGTTSTGASDVYDYFKKDVFSNPKPVELIRFLLGFGLGENDIVLDFFSGSGTTAEAVMRSNLEGGKNKFILVQLPENIDPLVNSSSANAKRVAENAVSVLDEMEHPHLLTELAKERIRRAGEKIKSESPLTTADLDVGFRVLKLDDTNMKDVYYAPDDYDQGLLAGLESNIKDDRTDLDLLFGCLLDWGLPLSMSYSSEQIEGCTVHTYNDGDLIACFDENVPKSVVEKIAKRQPLRVVFRDSSFANSPAKINVTEIFKLLAPDTRVKVI